jgi:hypothetical protein
VTPSLSYSSDVALGSFLITLIRVDLCKGEVLHYVLHEIPESLKDERFASKVQALIKLVLFFYISWFVPLVGLMAGTSLVRFFVCL